MFELLALLVVGAIVIGIFAIVGVVLKAAVSLIVLPFKLLLLPFVGLLLLVKLVVVLAVGAALVAVFIGVIVPVIVVGSLFAIPIAIIAAVS
ncbi:MAG: hypothetical protein WA208_03215 [Thermoanaerobaculia bacterium]